MHKVNFTAHNKLLLLECGDCFFPSLISAINDFTVRVEGSMVAIMQREVELQWLRVGNDAWSTVGSSNYDGLSLFVNQEANVVVRDTAFSCVLRQAIERGIADGIVVDPEAFAPSAGISGCGTVPRIFCTRVYCGLLRLESRPNDAVVKNLVQTVPRDI